MTRKEFIEKTGFTCLGLMGSTAFLQGCSGLKYVSAPIVGSDLQVSKSAFITESKGKTSFRKFIVVENAQLQYPVFVYRQSETDYFALLMRCTHQGTELQAFGDRLQCPAHGSEFSLNGEVQNGPADESLRTFPLTLDNENILVDLK